VVVPETRITPAKQVLVELLESYAVNTRWASGEDVKESVSQVVVTDYDSIVGLEFDAVFAMSVEQRLSDPTVANKLSVWVALTRARKFLHVSRVGSDQIFDHAEFEPYRNRSEME